MVARGTPLGLGPPPAKSRQRSSAAAKGWGGKGVSTPNNPDTLAILAAFKDSPTLNEAVAQGFRALALLKSPEPLAPDRLFRIADELDP